MRKGASFAVAATGAALLSAALLGCSGNDGQSQAPLARVDVVTANVVDFAPRVTLTGTIQAQVQNDLSFSAERQNHRAQRGHRRSCHGRSGPGTPRSAHPGGGP